MGTSKLSQHDTKQDTFVSEEPDQRRGSETALPPNDAQEEDNIIAAKLAAEREKDMGVWQAIRAYPKAVCFSMILSMSLIMESYDLTLTRNFFGLPQFRKRFGHPLDNGDYHYKKTIVGCMLFLTCFIFLFFFATRIEMLFAASILCGLPWGAFQTLTTTYAADVTPLALRPILTTFVNMCWTIGYLISGGVLRGLLGRKDDWAWRIPYAIQWAFLPPLITAVLFTPESPIWLVRKCRLDDARKSLRRLTSASTWPEEEIERKVALIEYENRMEKKLTEGVSYLDCFKGTNLKRTEITCCAWLAQIACGASFASNGTYFLQQVGLDPAQSFNFSLGTSGLALLGTLLAWFILTRVGRRRLYLCGLASLFLILLTIGFMGIPAPMPGVAWASGVLLMIFVAIYDLTIGPIGYCLVSEIPSSRLRIKTVILARNTYNIASICANFLNPPILNPTAWNLRGKGGFIWASFCLLILVWSYFRLPETRGLTQAEIDLLFEEQVSTKDFGTTEVEPFRSVG
ncbi:unnamed protein product [Clonostachys byssicola]|uniref:Major facilitator superfamily (MFS) profile domain-containing protein n=1 Tax=Clonostachys byssicola TaxID=160290 RepID=A0A9N9U2G8_9HYPO|nr:unnamed protein product [Clonostachys byssicola]